MSEDAPSPGALEFDREETIVLRRDGVDRYPRPSIELARLFERALRDPVAAARQLLKTIIGELKLMPILPAVDVTTGTEGTIADAGPRKTRAGHPATR